MPNPTLAAILHRIITSNANPAKGRYIIWLAGHASVSFSVSVYQ
jgi:hypothetical protein